MSTCWRSRALGRGPRSAARDHRLTELSVAPAPLEWIGITVRAFEVPLEGLEVPAQDVEHLSLGWRPPMRFHIGLDRSLLRGYLFLGEQRHAAKVVTEKSRLADVT